MKKNIHSSSCVSTSINWMYEKSYDPTKLVRYDIKNGPIGRIEPLYEIVEYETIEGFNIKKNPKEVSKFEVLPQENTGNLWGYLESVAFYDHKAVLYALRRYS